MIPEKYEVFGPDWCSVEDVRRSVGAVEGVFEWVRDVKAKTHDFIASLTDEDFRKPVVEDGSELTVAHWLFITAAHSALHIGRIQLLRALIEGKQERAC